MAKVKTIVTRAAGELAEVLGLSKADAAKWERHAGRKRASGTPKSSGKRAKSKSK